MAALIVAIAVMAVLMSAAMPVWKHLAQREKEEELVFRGEQIAHAIGMFQRRTANAYPLSLDVLVQQHLLRKKYKDPITNEDFVAIPQGQGQPQGGQNGRGAQPGRGAPQVGAGPGAANGPVGGIIGVTSKSTAESIRLYKGRSHYNEWAFIYTPPAAAPGAAVPGGIPGRGGQVQPGINAPGGGFPGRGGRGPFQPNPGGPGRGRTPFSPGANGVDTIIPGSQRGR